MLERSSDGIKFKTIADRQAQTSTSSRAYCQHTDDLGAISGNVFFYCLKMIDAAGSYKYSKVIMIRKNQKSSTGVMISQNPLPNGYAATARFNAGINAAIELKIVDFTGRVLLTRYAKIYQGVNSVLINNTEKLLPGMYLLRTNDGAGIQTTRFLIVR
jgi:hypothetical protein